MKKIICLSFSFLMVIISVVNFLNYSNASSVSIFKGLDSVYVEKPEGIKNRAFVKQIEKIAEELNIDIAYQVLSDNAKTMNIYKTNNTDDFLNINLQGESQKLAKNQCISTLPKVDGYEVIPLYISTFVRNTTVYPIENCDYTCLAVNTIIVSENDEGIFLTELENAGIELGESSAPVAIFGNIYDEAAYTVCPLLVVVFSIFIYFLSNAKKHTLKRLEGYSPYEIMLEEIGTVLLRLAIIFVIAEGLNVLLFAIHNINLLQEYLQYTAGSILAIYIPIIILATLLSSVTVIFHGSNLYIKGKESKTPILVLSAIIKTVTFVLMCLPLISSATSLPKCIADYITVSDAYAKLENYVAVRMTDSNDKNESKLLQKFYQKVEKENNAVINEPMYSSDILNGYDKEYIDNIPEYIDNEHGFTYEYYRYVDNCRFTLNTNFLKINPIYKTNGKSVSKKDFDDNKYNLLVPENAEYVDDLIKTIKYNYQKEDMQFNVIYYKPNQKVLITAYGNNDAYAVDPYIIIDDGTDYYSVDGFDYPIAMIGNQNEFMIEVSSDNPYKEIMKIAQEVGVEENIIDVVSANTVLANQLANSEQTMIQYAIQTILYAFLYVFLTVFFIKTYQETYQSQIAVKKLSGGGVFMLHKKYIWASVIMLMLTVLGVVTQMIVQEMLYTTPIIYGIATPIILWVIEMIFFALYASRLTRKNILETLKGVK